MNLDGRPGRPTGDVRSAIAHSLVTHGPATVRQVVQHACVGYDAARYTLSRMVAADQAMAVGPEEGAALPPGRHALVKQYVLACRLPLPEELPRSDTPAPSWWRDVLVVDLNRGCE